MDADWVWMQHTEHGGKARMAAGSQDFWRANGWVDCEPDPDPDLTQDHGDPPVPEPEPEPEPAAKPKKTAKTAGRGAATTEEGE